MSTHLLKARIRIRLYLRPRIRRTIRQFACIRGLLLNRHRLLIRLLVRCQQTHGVVLITLISHNKRTAPVEKELLRIQVGRRAQTMHIVHTILW